jgi:hypothetical protein
MKMPVKLTIYRIIAEKASPMIMGGDESAILIFSQAENKKYCITSP